MAARLSFRDVHYWIKPKSGNDDLHILKGVSGDMVQGRFYALLGSSGSGKTTLLDLLAKRKEDGHWFGEISYNGQELKKNWKRTCGYVRQHDNLLSSATVEETLMFSSQLRTSNTYEEHVEKVDGILEELSLSHRKGSRIGGEGNKVLSGGELRRVSIGQELVANCQVLLLDEPTSGLDSSQALSIVQLLKTMSRKGRIVAATLHQPSSEISDLFDDMLLLSHGRVCYQGPFAHLVDHISSIGFDCPLYQNPTDYIMHLCRDENAVNVMMKAVPACEPLSVPALCDGAVDKDQGTAEEKEDGDDKEDTVTQSWWFQFQLLWKRSFVQWYRNNLLLISELIQYLFCGFFMGFMYFQFSGSLDSGMFDRLSAIFFALTVVMFVPSFTVITVSGEEFPLLKRETSSGMYSLSASFMAKLCTVWPFECVLTALFVLPAYFLSGFQVVPHKFFEFFLVLLLALLISETIGLLCAVTTKTPTIGVLVCSLVLLVAMALGGFLVSEKKSSTAWTEYINFFVFANTALMLNQFSGLVLYTNAGQPVNDLVRVLRDAGRIRGPAGSLSIWGNIGVLVLFLVVLRSLAFFLLSFKVNSKPVKRSKALPEKIMQKLKHSRASAVIYSV